MGQQITPAPAGSPQATPHFATVGDSGDGSNEAGQPEFSMGIVPEGSATAKQSKASSPGAGQAPTAGERTIFEGGAPGTEGAAEPEIQKNKSDQNAESKSQRNSQEGWQQMVETLTKVNERLDKFETQLVKPEAAKPAAEAAQPEAMAQVLETLDKTNNRLERMEFERENSDLLSPEYKDEWKKINSDPKFKEFTMEERAQHVRGKKGAEQAGALRDQLSRSEGSMPRGSGSAGSAPVGGNPNITPEDIAVGRAFGFTQKELEEELS